MAYGKPLSNLYGLFMSGHLTKKELEGGIFRYLLDNRERYHIFDDCRERWSDFLSWLYTRLCRVIDLYKEKGASFDAYVTGFLHNVAREYRCRESDRHITEYVCWQARAEEMRIMEEEPEYCHNSGKKPIPENINPRQLLFLLLKSYYFATEEMIKQVAEANDLETGEVREMIDKIRAMRSDKEDEIREMQDRVYCQYYRCLAYHKRMKSAHPGTDYFNRMKERFARAKQRYHTMRKRLGTKRKAASNRMIAEVLGIPPGTVDSGLYSVKSRLAGYVETGE